MAAAAFVVLSILAAIGAATLGLAAFILLGLLLLQPWNASNRDQLAPAAAAPYHVFLAAAWLRHLWYRLADNIPGPMRGVEASTAFLKSQVLFVLVNLGVPDALTNSPRTAVQLAAACGCPNTEWLERVLDAAVAYRLLCRRPVRPSTATTPSAASPGRSTMAGAHGISPVVAASPDVKPGRDQQPPTSTSSPRCAPRSSSNDPTHLVNSKDCTSVASAPGAASSDGGQLVSELGGQYEYYSNSLTACLRSDHPSSTAAMVKLNEFNYAVASQLSQALLAGATPQQLQHGTPFWDGLVADPVKGAVFDQAMHSEKHCMAGVTVVTSWPWRRVGGVVDVGGGTGGFMALLLTAHPHLRGVVLDQKEQVERGRALWSQQYRHLLPRMTFHQGNMFKGDTLPTPHEATLWTTTSATATATTVTNDTTSRGSNAGGSGAQGAISCSTTKAGAGRGVVYLLHSILHNWGTQDALNILRSIRTCIGSTSGPAGCSPPVQLLLIEVTSSSHLQSPLREARLTCDLVMLGNFGGGRERDERQYKMLLEASGFRLVRLTPTKGLFVVVEAVPV